MSTHFTRALPAWGRVGLAVFLVLTTWAPAPFTAEARTKVGRSKLPDLRILDVTLSPIPFSPEAGVLELMINVELPKELGSANVLEVSSLIASPSRRSLRFLAERQTLDAASAPSDSTIDEGKPRIQVKLSWDGTDQSHRRVQGGRFSYEVKAKLLTMGESGPRTQMVSWPKRGTLEVK